MKEVAFASTTELFRQPIIIAIIICFIIIKGVLISR